MTSLIKKMKKGKAYYYAVRSGRVNGKPRITWQKYLGSVEAIVQRCEQNLAPLPSETVLFEAGGVAAFLKIADRLNLIQIIDEEVPKREQGPSVGHYMLLAALNRVLDPASKAQMADWYHETVLQRLWNFSPDLFSSQRFWDHMHKIPEEALQRMQDRIALKIRQEFKIDPQLLLYDSTNFFTYIDTHNDRNTLAQRGHNKQKRSDLRQVNLALLATRDFQIPLFHQLYEGDIPDVKSFPEISEQLLKRHQAIWGVREDATLVFDKGNLSDETMETLLYKGVYFLAAAKTDFLPEIFSTPLDRFQTLPLESDARIYEREVELCGKKIKTIVVYSESFFTQQLAVLTAAMARCQDQLKEVQKNLLSWRKKPKRRRGLRPTQAQVKKRVETILSGQHMGDVFSVSITQVEGVPHLHYSVNRKALDELMGARLGRTLLITNRTKWLPPEIVSTYRDLVHIEETFKNMKNRDYLRWQPAFHWTDQKLKVHTFYCVVAMLLATLARKVAYEAQLSMSLPALLKDLSAIREVALLYPTGKGKVRAQFTLSKMTPRQKKLAQLFEIGDVLTAG